MVNFFGQILQKLIFMQHEICHVNKIQTSKVTTLK